MTPPRRKVEDAGREWLTRGEIQSVVHGEMKDALERQNTILDKIADAVQGNVQANVVLLGNPALGIKGAVPEIQAKLEAIDAREAQHHTDNLNTGLARDAAISAIAKQVEELQKGQGRIRRCFQWALRIMAGQTVKEGGEEKESSSTWKYALIVALAGFKYIWSGIKWAAVWIAHHFAGARV